METSLLGQTAPIHLKQVEEIQYVSIRTNRKGCLTAPCAITRTFQNYSADIADAVQVSTKKIVTIVDLYDFKYMVMEYEINESDYIISCHK